MLRVWRSPELRSTMDIDMLGKTSNKEADIIAQIRDILSMDVEADGLAFDADSIQAERITEDADYEGIRIRFRGTLDSARINMQVDIGFGDVGKRLGGRSFRRDGGAFLRGWLILIGIGKAFELEL